MKNINKLTVLLFLVVTTSGISQNISELYDKANKSVVLIKTLQPEVFGQGQQ